MASYHNSPDPKQNLFPSTQNIRVRQQVQAAVPNANPDLIAAAVNAAEAQRLPPTPAVIRQLSQHVAQQQAAQNAAHDAAYQQTLRKPYR